MSQLSNLFRRIDQLAPADRAELVERLTGQRDEAGIGSADPPDGQPSDPEPPRVVKTPGICGVSARVVGTRIPVWSLVRLRQLGASEADIRRGYPTLRAFDLVRAWAYAEAHGSEIEREVRENEER